MIESLYQLPRVTSDGFQGQCIEGAGAGLFAVLIRRADDADADIDDSWALLRQVIIDAPTARWSVGIDGPDVSGDYLAVHATVVRQTGPNLTIAPEADPSALEINVVLVRERQRQELTDYVDDRRRGDQPQSPTFEVISARRVEVSPRLVAWRCPSMTPSTTHLGWWSTPGSSSSECSSRATARDAQAPVWGGRAAYGCSSRACWPSCWACSRSSSVSTR